MHYVPLFHSDRMAKILMQNGPIFTNVFVADGVISNAHIFSAVHLTEKTANLRWNLWKKFYGKAKYRIVVRLKEQQNG